MPNTITKQELAPGPLKLEHNTACCNYTTVFHSKEYILKQGCNYWLINIIVSFKKSDQRANFIVRSNKIQKNIFCFISLMNKKKTFFIVGALFTCALIQSSRLTTLCCLAWENCLEMRHGSTGILASRGKISLNLQNH